ncbi:MAG: hybrid sensor histidine kinase/response regulator [Myxococcota bacterium]|nr:hybrid sensor histidine kinase/response regulator [Myxococcota bacterium]
MPETSVAQGQAAHLVVFTPDDSLLEGAATFLGEGLARRDHVLAFLPGARRAALLAELSQRGFAVQSLLDQGSLQIIAADALVPALADEERGDRYLELNIFGPAREAMTAAHSGRVRIYSELCNLLWSAQGPQAAEALERKFNAFAFSYPVVLFCGYGLAPDVAGNDRLRALHSELLWDPRSGMVEQRLRLLARASEVLASTLDYEGTLQNTLGLVLPVLGDFGFFDVLERNGEVRRLARAHQDPTLEGVLSQTRWARNERADMNLCGLSTGASGFHSHIDEEWMGRAAASPEHLEVMRGLGFCSMITVPLPSRGRVLGALTLFHSVSRRHHSRGDLAFGEEVARRAAAAVENARLYQDLQEAVRRRDEADRRKDDFLAMLGHELRNPLAPILTAARLIELKGDASVAREREVISRQAEHLTRLVDDLLDVSRIVRGKIELRREQVELRAVLSRAVEIAAPLVEERRHQLSVELPDGLTLDGDRGRLAQIFANLLTNAAKYTEPEGRITVSTSVQDGQVTVAISDTGVGIDPGHRGRLFEEFFQAESTMDRSQGGLGLGLALVKSLTELHGGRVEVHSAGRGQGSEFRVTLPLGVPGPARAKPVLATLSPGQTARLLVVDDNEDLAATLGEALSFSGYQVQVVNDAAQALTLAATHPLDIALLDIGLPVMDGYELARRLRESAAGRPLRLIAVSGYGTDKDRARSAAAGFEAHLVKPVDFNALLELLSRQ